MWSNNRLQDPLKAALFFTVYCQEAVCLNINFGKITDLMLGSISLLLCHSRFITFKIESSYTKEALSQITCTFHATPTLMYFRSYSRILCVISGIQ